jgi:hypothetical protein
MKDTSDPEAVAAELSRAPAAQSTPEYTVPSDAKYLICNQVLGREVIASSSERAPTPMLTALMAASTSEQRIRG